MDPSMKPERIAAPPNMYFYGVPVNDVDQARKAMKDHEKFLSNYLGQGKAISFVPGPGTKGNVGANYRTAAIEGGTEFRITDSTLDKTVYFVRGAGGKNHELTVEIGKEKNAMGKDLLVIKPTQILGCDQVPTCVLCCMLCFCCCCCLAPCAKSAMRATVLTALEIRMASVQYYVNNYEPTTNSEDTKEKDSAAI